MKQAKKDAIFMHC